MDINNIQAQGFKSDDESQDNDTLLQRQHNASLHSSIQPLGTSAIELEIPLIKSGHRSLCLPIRSPEETPLPVSSRTSVYDHYLADGNHVSFICPASGGRALDTDCDSILSATSSFSERCHSGTPTDPTSRPRSDSSATVASSESGTIDWDELERSEEQAPRQEDSAAFLLARLEEENNALATDPKAKLARSRSLRDGPKPRPTSIHKLKKLVTEPTKSSLRYSLTIEPPAMTEMEFWLALVNDFPQTALRLPTLTSSKIRGGIPAPLRGVVWMSIAGARDAALDAEYERLCGQSSPYEGLIGKDVGRSFPSIDMFREPGGDGQQMLGRVLKCFSIFDDGIGYCQGLGFVVGPLLMHMADKEAFCVLVRLMEQYDLRSCFLPDLSGLHLRIYQYQTLLTTHFPALAVHLESIGIEPLYISQWFLSFFAITCPLPMLLRIYDVILTEGASETLMRVALSLMQRNETRLLECKELEDAMSLLLGRALWDTYKSNADDLVQDFVGLTGKVTREVLESLEQAFKCRQEEEALAKEASPTMVQAAASRLLGRFWNGNAASPSAKSTSPTISLAVKTGPPRSINTLHRTPSKQSMASTLNSAGSTETCATSVTAQSHFSQSITSDDQIIKSALPIARASQDRDLHTQIEDLLMALSDLQREQSILSSQLQKEREDRGEDYAVVHKYLSNLEKTPCPLLETTMGEEDKPMSSIEVPDKIFVPTPNALQDLSRHFISTTTGKRSSLTFQSKHELRESLQLWKDQYEIEASRTADLSMHITASDLELNRLQGLLLAKDTEIEVLRKGNADREATIQELRMRRYDTESDFESIPDTLTDQDDDLTPIPPSISTFAVQNPEQSISELHHLKTPPESPVIYKHRATASTSTLGPDLTPAPARTSSLGTAKILATENHKPLTQEAMLVELVSAKTAEASTRQELEEVKSKLDSLRRIVSGGTAEPQPSVLPVPEKVATIPSIDGAAVSSYIPSTSIFNFGFGSSNNAATLSPSNTNRKSLHRPSPSESTITNSRLRSRSPGPVQLPTTPPDVTLSDARLGSPITMPSSAGVAGFFSGWVRRNPSVSMAPPTPSVTVTVADT